MADPFNKNITTLQKHNPRAAAQIIHTNPAPIRIEQSRNNLPIPCLISDGHTFPLHSRFNPLAEGEKLTQGIKPAGRQAITPKHQIGYLISFGMGAAHHLIPIMKTPHLCGLLIIDSPPILKAILTHIDLRHLLADPRLKLLLNPTPPKILNTLQSNYNPILHGRLGTHILRPLWKEKETWLTHSLHTINQHIKHTARDTATQNRLGSRWLHNILSNLPLITRQPTQFQHCLQQHGLPTGNSTAAIIAAGPSLNTQIPKLTALKHRGTTLISTDTALPFLTHRGLIPHIVISIDAQQTSYHHFLDGLPSSTILLLDIGSPPTIARTTPKTIFFASNHPLAIYIHHFFHKLPLLDLSAGNVTHAALSLCLNLNIKNIHIFGADFSYPHGIPYAVNTYIPRHFHSHSQRLRPAEQAFHELIHLPGMKKQHQQENWKICGGILEEYKKNLLQTLEQAKKTQGINSLIHGQTWHNPRTSRTLDPAPSPQKASPPPHLPETSYIPPHHPSTPPSPSSPAEYHPFLKNYIKELSRLPELKGQLETYLADLTPRARQTWATILPLCAALHPGQGNEGWQKTRNQTIMHINRIMENKNPSPEKQ